MYRILIILFFFPSVVFSQQLFDLTLGNTDDDNASAVVVTSDGGIVVTGLANDMPYPKISLLVKINADGDTVWKKTLNYLLAENAYNIKETSDQGLVVIGEGKYCVNGNCGTDAFVVRLDKDGEVLWGKGYGATAWDDATDIEEMPGGGFILCGETVSIGQGSYDMFIMRIGSNGDTLWHKSFGGVGQDYCTGIARCSDGGFIISGGYRAGSQTAPVLPVLIRTDSSGNQLWAKTYDTGSLSWLMDVEEVSDGFICLTRSGLMKTDLSGNEIWTKSYFGFSTRVGFDYYSKMELAADGGFYITGQYISGSDYDAMMIKTDSAGDVIYNRRFGGSSAYDYATDIKVLPDGRLVMCGGTSSYGAGGEDAFVSVFEDQPPTGNCGSSVTLQTNTVNPTVANVTPVEDKGLWVGTANFGTHRPDVPLAFVCQDLVSRDSEILMKSEWQTYADHMKILPSTAFGIRIRLRISDLQGRILLDGIYSRSEAIQFYTTHLPPVFIAELLDEKGVLESRIIRQHK